MIPFKDSFINKNPYGAGIAVRLTLKVEAVQTLKGHESKLQLVSETVSKGCVVLTLDMRMDFSTNIMVIRSEKVVKGASGTS